MKKILFMIMVICLMVINVNYIYAASTNVSSEEKYENLFPLHVFLPYENSLFGYSDVAIEIVPNETHTFLMSYDYIGEYLDEVLDGEFEYEFEFEPNLYGAESLAYTNDAENQIVYVEFEPINDMILFWVPYLFDVNGYNYDIMLIKGTYQDFQGFIPYTTKDFESVVNGELVLDIDEKMSIEEIERHVHAYNRKNEEIAYEITDSNYLNDLITPGVYQMTFTATVNNLRKDLILNVHLIDQTPPTIHGPEVIEVSYDDRPSIEDLLKNFSVTDNVDSLDWQDLVIIKDYYTGYDRPGYHLVEISVTDSSGNESSFSFSVNTIDQNGPVIRGQSSMILYTSDSPLTNEEILSKYEAIDNVDGTSEIEIIYNEYEQTTAEGVYEIKLKSVDGRGNETYQSIHIHVIDNQGPIFEVDEPIVISTSTVLTSTDVLIKIKNKLNQQNNDIKNIKIINNEYEGHEHKPGVYQVYYEYDYLDNTYLSRIEVHVEETKNQLNYVYISAAMILAGITTYLFVLKRKKKIARKKD